MADLNTRVNRQGSAIRGLREQLGHIEESLASVDSRLATIEAGQKIQIGHAVSGNWTRNLIAGAVAVRFLIEGFHSIDWNNLEHILKLFGG